MSTQADTDAHWMRDAVAMAESGLGTTAPNPSVGAVLVRDGVELSRAVTQPGGRPHAETEALRLAGEAARGATLYVTLEPCSHVGKTGPCAEAVIAAGVARVVVGIEDPDPRVAGRGLAMLRAAGVEVVVGVEAKACRWVTLGHILRVTERRPFVQSKLAVSSNGIVPQAQNGAPVWVTGPTLREQSHLLRAKTDAIMVGIGTVLADDPELTCRLPGLENRSPIRVVMDRHLRLPVSSKLARTAKTTATWIFCYRRPDASLAKPLEIAGVRILPVIPNSQIESAGHGPSPFEIRKVMNVLASEGVTRLLVEGGPKLSRYIDAQVDLVDEYLLFRGSRELASEDGTLVQYVWAKEWLDRLIAMPLLQFGAESIQSYRNDQERPWRIVK